MGNLVEEYVLIFKTFQVDLLFFIVWLKLYKFIK